MMSYQNDQFVPEQYYDQMYERSEKVDDTTCPECKGIGQTQYCIDCGLHHEECDCHKPDLINEVCEKCFGRGEV